MSKRFGQIDYSIPKASRKVLSSQLSEMVEDGLITRHTYQESPPRVEYQLTERGEALVPIFKNLANWVQHLIKD